MRKGKAPINKISYYRKQMKMTMQELADQLNVSKRTVYDIEKGSRVPSLLISFEIANLFGVPIEEMFVFE